MNAELEALINALDAVHNAQSGADAERLNIIYLSRLEDAQARMADVSIESLKAFVAQQLVKWLATQKKSYTTLPPRHKSYLLCRE